ncbi:MAG: AmmeMemoRadiSam system protein B [Ilumatobacteraceae bacterium]
MAPSADVVREPAVAGSFYPADPGSLRAALDASFGDAVAPRQGSTMPRAIVVPHAGYVFSGPVAASAYLLLEAPRTSIRRVVVLGPAHRVPLRGLALSSARAWSTPLGTVPTDSQALDQLQDVTSTHVDDIPHAPEHSIEVQLPFLQTVLDDFVIVPIVVGRARDDEVAAAIDALWSDETLVVVSTDLSHYHPYADAARLDAQTSAAIVSLRPELVTTDAACGAIPLRGLLTSVRRRHLSIDELDRRSSGDTAGDRRSVVGYGAFAVR